MAKTTFPQSSSSRASRPSLTADPAVTCSGMMVVNAKDYALLLAACDVSAVGPTSYQASVVPSPPRLSPASLRPKASHLVRSGAVFAWESHPNAGSGWKDGLVWGPRRRLSAGDCLSLGLPYESVYEYMQITKSSDPDVKKAQYEPVPGGLIRRVFHMVAPTTKRRLCVVSYSTLADVQAGKLRRPSQDARFVGPGGGLWNIDMQHVDFLHMFQIEQDSAVRSSTGQPSSTPTQQQIADSVPPASHAAPLLSEGYCDKPIAISDDGDDEMPSAGSSNVASGQQLAVLRKDPRPRSLSSQSTATSVSLDLSESGSLQDISSASKATRNDSTIQHVGPASSESVLKSVSHYSQADVDAGRLRSPSQNPRFVGPGGGTRGLDVDSSISASLAPRRPAMAPSGQPLSPISSIASNVRDTALTETHVNERQSQVASELDIDMDLDDKEDLDLVNACLPEYPERKFAIPSYARAVSPEAEIPRSGRRRRSSAESWSASSSDWSLSSAVLGGSSGATALAASHASPFTPFALNDTSYASPATDVSAWAEEVEEDELSDCDSTYSSADELAASAWDGTAALDGPARTSLAADGARHLASRPAEAGRTDRIDDDSSPPGTGGEPHTTASMDEARAASPAPACTIARRVALGSALRTSTSAARGCLPGLMPEATSKDAEGWKKPPAVPHDARAPGVAPVAAAESPVGSSPAAPLASTKTLRVAPATADAPPKNAATGRNGSEPQYLAPVASDGPTRFQSTKAQFDTLRAQAQLEVGRTGAHSALTPRRAPVGVPTNSAGEALTVLPPILPLPSPQRSTPDGASALPVPPVVPSSGAHLRGTAHAASMAHRGEWWYSWMRGSL